MKFKISVQDNNAHKRLVACVAWSSTEEIYSYGQDHLLICWHLEGSIAHSTVVTEFPNDFYPTVMQWHPYLNTSIAKKSSLDVLLITTADGQYHLVNKNGRIEKSVNAHKGAMIVGRWSNDDSALLTAGEDALIKIWSRSGMLRSTIIKTNLPILTSSWSPDCSTILYSQGANLILQPLNSNSKSHKNEILWTYMAVMATDNKEFHAAEEAYAAIGRCDIVDYIRYIKSLSSTAEKYAEMALLARDLLAAEGILLQNGLIKEAIHINLEVYNWNRALELAVKHKRQIEEVLNKRAKYLQTINKNETNQSFLTLIGNISTLQSANKENEKKNYVKNVIEQIDVE